MAKFLSQVFSEIRGSIAGQTFARNHNGAYVRGRATPVNPSTSKQSAVRNAFGILASDWRALTEAQREDWITLAAGITFTDSLGQQIKLSGFQLYQKLNSNLLSSGQSKISDAPAEVTMPTWSFDTFIFEDVSGTLTMNVILYTDNDTDWIGVVEATDYSSAGKSSFSRSAYKFIQTVTLSTPSVNPNLETAYNAVYGGSGSKVGSKTSLRIRLVSTTTGFATPWEKLSAILVEGTP